MILVRSPLRITLGGGGTDLPSYYRDHGGFCISAAIDKFVFVSVTRPFYPGIYLKYSALEEVTRASEVQHPIIREVLTHVFPTDRIEITTLADVPAGTGLGSSSSFTTALIAAMASYHRFGLMSADLAKAACDVEITRLGNPIGKQDQFSAAYGGVNMLEFREDESVGVTPLAHSAALEDYLLLFYTGDWRQASSVLMSQQSMTENLHAVKRVGMESANALAKGDLERFGDLLNEQWRLKHMRCSETAKIQVARTRGLATGALGCKIVGAGGGGFLLFFTHNPSRLRTVMQEHGFDEMRFRFDYDGTTTVVNS